MNDAKISTRRTLEARAAAAPEQCLSEGRAGGNWFVVYAGGSRLDLCNTDMPVAFVSSSAQADALIAKLWPGTGYYRPAWVETSYKEN